MENQNYHAQSGFSGLSSLRWACHVSEYFSQWCQPSGVHIAMKQLTSQFKHIAWLIGSAFLHTSVLLTTLCDSAVLGMQLFSVVDESVR